MAILLKFGDVFSFAGDEYVYLAYTADVDILYTAKVLRADLTKRILASDRNAKRKPDYHKMLLYCFVVLTTDQFSERMAHFVKTDDNGISVGSYIERLNPADRNAIRKEILEGPMPAKLKDIILEATDEASLD